MRGHVDGRDAVASLVGDVRRGTVAGDGDPVRVVPHGDRRQDVSGRAALGDLDRRDGAAGTAVNAPVRDVARAPIGREGDRVGPSVGNGDRIAHLARGQVDRRDRLVAVVRHPRPRLARLRDDLDVDRLGTHGDRRAHRTRGQVDPGDRTAEGARVLVGHERRRAARCDDDGVGPSGYLDGSWRQYARQVDGNDRTCTRLGVVLRVREVGQQAGGRSH